MGRLASRILLFAILALGFCMAPARAEEEDCEDTPEGRICKIRQPIVAGTLVDNNRQRELGLVTVGGVCSGTLVNRWWVLTAQHCVSVGNVICGPLNVASNITVTATWSAQTPRAARLVDFCADGLDMALVYLGTDFGPAPIQLYYVDPLESGMTVTKFGRGMSTYATGSGATATPAQNDGLYRTANFTVSSATSKSITLNANSAGQVGHGGDSGGPDRVTSQGVLLGIAGVQSTCQRTGVVPAAPPGGGLWTWATGISSCTSAAVADVRDRIVTMTTRRAGNDFNDDGRGDILWYNSSSGETQIWFMGTSSRIGRATVLGEDGRPAFIGPPWHIVGSKDFDKDGKADVLWHNEATGETQLWYLDGHKLKGRATVLGEDRKTPILVGPPWSIVATGDMNSDGGADIIWHNSSTGETQIWFLSGHALSGRATVLGENGSPMFVGPPFSIVGSNDFNADAKSDIVWHNASTGETQVWLMDGFRVVGRPTVRDEKGAPIFVGLPFSVVGTNDFDQNGTADILWHNEASGETQMWLMNGQAIVGRLTVDAALDGGGAAVGKPWSIMNQ